MPSRRLPRQKNAPTERSMCLYRPSGGFAVVPWERVSMTPTVEGGQAMSEPDVEPAWRALFIHVAARAIRRVHLEQQGFALGYKGAEPSTINFGAGIECAHENYVTSAIAADFNTSKIPFGWYRDRKSARYYVIEQEQDYLNEKDKGASVDLVVKRVLPDDTDEQPQEFYRVFIEAKRAKNWTPDLRTGKAKEQDYNYTHVRDDIFKLVHEFKEDTKLFAYVLVWGICDTGAVESSGPSAFFEHVNGLVGSDTVEIAKPCCWLPLTWNGGESIGGGIAPSVTRWLWVVLAELTESKKRVVENRI